MSQARSISSQTRSRRVGTDFKNEGQLHKYLLLGSMSNLRIGRTIRDSSGTGPCCHRDTAQKALNTPFRFTSTSKVHDTGLIDSLDIHIILNTVQSPSILNSPASASWIPICLPKFNPSGFVNAYISFLRKDDSKDDDMLTSSQSDSSGDSTMNSRVTLTDTGHERESSIAVVCISGGADFDTIRGWCDSVTERIETEGILDAISLAIRLGQTEYSVSELGIPGLRHFVYKSRAQVQNTAPTFEDPYDDTQERRRYTGLCLVLLVLISIPLRRLLTLYQILHDGIHAKSGQDGQLKLQYIRTEKESVMGWVRPEAFSLVLRLIGPPSQITQPFEIYIALSPRLPKSAAVGAANAVARWIKKEEGRLFLRDAPAF